MAVTMPPVSTTNLYRQSINSHSGRTPRKYFTELTAKKAVFYLVALLYVVASSIIVCLEPIIPLPCTSPDPSTETKFENPAYVDDPCRHTRFARLLFLTPEECMFGRRIFWSVIMGGVVGWERRQADRPAGIRTMSLVSLGSCLFTVNSAFAFLSGPMTWDASRVSAAIPSGVGFLGAGMIFKEANKDEETGQAMHVVHGLTTAASLWLSAAVGIACGGGLYFAASFCVAVMLVLLRFGPRAANEEEEEDEDGNDDTSTQPLRDSSSSATGDGMPLREVSEMTPLKGSLGSIKERTAVKTSARTKKAQLGSIV